MLKKNLTFLLITIVLATAFLGGYHQFCDCYSHDCSICSQLDQHPFLLSRTGAADPPRILPALEGFIDSVAFVPDPSTAFSSLNGRAPPSNA